MCRPLILVAPIDRQAFGAQPSAPIKTSGKPVAKAPEKSWGRKRPDPDLIDTKAQCSITYPPPYKPTFNRDKF